MSLFTQHPAAEMAGAVIATTCAGLIASLPTPPEGLATEWGRFGAMGFMCLIAVLCILGWYKQSSEHRRSLETQADEHRKTMEKMVDQFLESSRKKDEKLGESIQLVAHSLTTTTALLAERPCIRNPKND